MEEEEGIVEGDQGCYSLDMDHGGKEKAGELLDGSISENCEEEEEGGELPCPIPSSLCIPDLDLDPDGGTVGFDDTVVADVVVAMFEAQMHQALGWEIGLL